MRCVKFNRPKDEAAAALPHGFFCSIVPLCSRKQSLDCWKDQKVKNLLGTSEEKVKTWIGSDAALMWTIASLPLLPLTWFRGSGLNHFVLNLCCSSVNVRLSTWKEKPSLCSNLYHHTETVSPEENWISSKKMKVFLPSGFIITISVTTELYLTFFYVWTLPAGELDSPETHSRAHTLPCSSTHTHTHTHTHWT